MNTTTKPALPPLPAPLQDGPLIKLFDDIQMREFGQTCDEHGYQRGLAEARAAFKPAYYSVTWNGEHCSNLWRLKADAEAACKRLNDKHPDAVRAIETLYELVARIMVGRFHPVYLLVYFIRKPVVAQGSSP